MANLVVVAIPSEGEHVWDISSEKIPHMTLLFLGEMPVPNFVKIANFVAHAADRSLYRFGMDVDRRGTLGEDEADVLYFSKNKWSGYETIAAFRSYLLQDSNIQAAYHSVDQFDEWTPHLTLGYPETPAKSEKDGRSEFYYVHFDRIALWFNDYDGFEYPLKSEYMYVGEVEMSNANVERGKEATTSLLHYGVKGMKWGVRRKLNRSSRVTVSTKAGGRIKTQGGANRKASPDAVRAKVSGQIAKKSGFQALSNKELRAYIERMNLEKQANKVYRQNSVGAQFVELLLANKK